MCVHVCMCIESFSSGRLLSSSRGGPSFPVYVCTYIWMCVYMHMYKYIHTYTYIYVHTHTHIYIHIYIYIYIHYVCVCMYVYVWNHSVLGACSRLQEVALASLCMYVHMCMCVCLPIRWHKHVCIQQ